MATFLELCQAVAAESGTINGVRPQTTVGQADRLGLVVSWVRQAWVDIQNSARWKFLRVALPPEAALVQGQKLYAPASFGIGAGAVPPLQSWILDRNTPLSIYDPDLGQADETEVHQVGYGRWRRNYDFGAEAAQTERPVWVAYDESASAHGSIVFGPAPDKAYPLRGFYWRTPQVFAADADVPIMPPQYHHAIKWAALKLLVQFDEADALAITTIDRELRSYLGPMRRDLLPRGGPYIDSESLGGSLGGRSFGGAFGPPPAIRTDTP